MLAAVILAAGESSRMGRPKALLLYRGRTFLEQLIEVTRHPSVTVTRIVLGAHADEIQQQIALDSAHIVLNTDWEKGQLSSIHAAIRSLPPGQTRGMLLCPVDHPLVSAGLVASLIDAFTLSGGPIVLPTYQRRRGHPLIFSSRLYDELLAAPHDAGARAVVRAHPHEILEVPTKEEGVVLNLDDPDTLARALSL